MGAQRHPFLAGIGLAIAGYGLMSLTGWLGEPPWWTYLGEVTIWSEDHVRGKGMLWPKPVPGRELISVGVCAAGLGILVWGLRPPLATDVPRVRRPRSDPHAAG